jgi:hypothetical protein
MTPPISDAAFRPEEMFVGAFEGWGVMETPLGALQKRYVVEAKGHLTAAGAISFSETWRFDDGHVDQLTWAIRRTDAGDYEGSEPRVDGTAEGQVDGFGFRWRYTRETPQPDGKSLKLNFDDWFWRIDARVMIARGTAGRLGLPFAVAHVTYRRLD